MATRNIIADNPLLKRLLDKMESALETKNETTDMDVLLYAMAFLDRIMTMFNIDAVDITGADIAYMFSSVGIDKVESVYYHPDTNTYRLRTEHEGLICTLDEVTPPILYELCKFLGDSEKIEMAVTR